MGAELLASLTAVALQRQVAPALQVLVQFAREEPEARRALLFQACAELLAASLLASAAAAHSDPFLVLPAACPALASCFFPMLLEAARNPPAHLPPSELAPLLLLVHRWLLLDPSVLLPQVPPLTISIQI